MHILQVCNVGQIVGGTAACAWTITKALADCTHSVAFLGQIAPETRKVFSNCQLYEWQQVTASHVARLSPDLVILHNTSQHRFEFPLTTPTIQYVHSRITPTNANLTLYCSKWLARQCRASEQNALHQAVPVPPKITHTNETRSLREKPVIGRLCTPQSKKWPTTLVKFYESLATKFPDIQWEFVGCPQRIHEPLTKACGGNARFHEPGWHQRSLFWEWDALLYHNPHVTESFGRTVAEAMRAGCIPIVDQRGGFTEQIAEETGFLCADSNGFQAAIEQICHSGERRRRSRACREHAGQQFSLTRFRRDFLNRIREEIEYRLSSNNSL